MNSAIANHVNISNILTIKRVYAVSAIIYQEQGLNLQIKEETK
jgi:hypothetical protein